MTHADRLLHRLEEIGRSLSGTPRALALLGLGSVGLDTGRLDEFSDLDFFVIVGEGEKSGFLSDLSWLERVQPVAFAFMNTADGYKLLFADGIFCEFAVFERTELAGIPYPPARIVWKREEVDDRIALPAPKPPQPQGDRREWLLGEALTNLYVGLARERRGERLSAFRFIQGYAVDRVIELVEILEPVAADGQDPFAPERRFEQRFERTAEFLPAWMQGYAHNVESARAILEYLEAHFSVSKEMAAAVRQHL